MCYVPGTALGAGDCAEWRFSVSIPGCILGAAFPELPFGHLSCLVKTFRGLCPVPRYTPSSLDECAAQRGLRHWFNEWSTWMEWVSVVAGKKLWLGFEGLGRPELMFLGLPFLVL